MADPESNKILETISISRVEYDVIKTWHGERPEQKVLKVRARVKNRRERGFQYVIVHKGARMLMRAGALYDLTGMLDDVCDAIEDGKF